MRLHRFLTTSLTSLRNASIGGGLGFLLVASACVTACASGLGSADGFPDAGADGTTQPTEGGSLSGPDAQRVPDARSDVTMKLPPEAGTEGGADGSSDGVADGPTDGPPIIVDSGPDLIGVTGISLGGPNMCALLTGGIVDCWGDNQYGELGIGTASGPDACLTACSETPRATVGLTGVKAISVGAFYACALLSAGTLDCWGDDALGELGVSPSSVATMCGTVACVSAPGPGPTLTGVSAVYAGNEQTCALMTDTTVKCWGQVNENDVVNSTPTSVAGLTGVTQLAMGSGHVCALLSGGTVSCWGINGAGQLGIGTSSGPATCGGTTCSLTPVAVPGLTGVTAIAAASESTCALLSGGTIECWGDNEYGELGDGTTAGPETCEFTGPCSTSPVAVLGLSNATAIAASAFDVCAILTDQTVRCWGNDDVGQIGNPGSGVGTETCSDGSPHCATSPTTVSGLTKVTALAMGGDSACALLMGGRVECWGSNETGELGNGTTTNAPAPALVSSP